MLEPSRGAELAPWTSPLEVQPGFAAREPGRDILDVLLRQAGGEALHDGVVALAAPVVVEGLDHVVVVLAREDRLIPGRRLGGVRALCKAEQREGRDRGSERFHFAALP